MQQYLKIFLLCGLLMQAARGELMPQDEMMGEALPLTEQQQEQAPKINWLPVWQEVEVHGAEMKHHHESEQTAPIGIPVEASITIQDHHHQHILKENIDKCAAPNGLGIKNLLQQAKTLLPLKQIKSLILSASSDPELQALKRLATSPEFRAKAAALKRSAEFGAMREYSCQVLHFDLKYYAEFLRAIFHPMLSFSDLPDHSEVKASTGGIRALLRSIRDVLPVQQLRDTYARLLASDESLKQSIAHMKSKENLQILLNVYNRPEYKEMRKMLTDIGVPLDAMRELVATAFGFQGQMIGDVMGVLI